MMRAMIIPASVTQGLWCSCLALVAKPHSASYQFLQDMQFADVADRAKGSVALFFYQVEATCHV
jgi:hypothetical protein